MKISLLLLALVAGIAANNINEGQRQDIKKLADIEQELEDFFLEDEDDEEEDDFDEEDEDDEQSSSERFFGLFGGDKGVCAGKAKGTCTKQQGTCVTEPFDDNCKALHGDVGKLKKLACSGKDCQCCVPAPTCKGKIKNSCSKKGGHCVLKPFKSNCKGGELNKRNCKSKNCQCCIPASTTPAPAPTTPAPVPTTPAPAPTTAAPAEPTSNGGSKVEDIPCDWPTGKQYWPHPNSCKMFVQCTQSGPQVMDCAPGTAWSQTWLACVHEYKVDCDRHPATDNGGANPTTAAAPPTPKKTTPPPKTTQPPPPPTTLPPKPTTAPPPPPTTAPPPPPTTAPPPPPTTAPPKPTTLKPTTRPWPKPKTTTPIPTTQDVPEDRLLPSIPIRSEHIEYKQNSFMGIGGHREQDYNLVLARGPSPQEEFVYIQKDYPQDELINVCDLQYSSYKTPNGKKGVFFVYHDKSQKPYAKRFGLKGHGIDQEILDAISEDADSDTFPGIDSSSSFWDFNWFMGDNLKDVDC